MATWAPDLYAYYAETLGKVHSNDPSLQRPFVSSVFSPAAHNFGPKTVCFRHFDFANLPFGWCSITALGSYDPKQGGHLILWECGLVVEFPPGSTILLPSAIISHSNVTIASHERRYCWAENGCQTAAAFRASATEDEMAKWEDQNATRWKRGLSLIPVFEAKDAALGI